MALVFHAPGRAPEIGPQAPDPTPDESRRDAVEAGASPSAEEASWLARLDEVFAETGWPDA